MTKIICFMRLMVYENGEETMYKMQAALIAGVFQDQQKNDKLAKCWAKCLDNRKKLRQQTKCKHGRERSRCKDFGESQSCEHKKIKSSCKDWQGSNL